MTRPCFLLQCSPRRFRDSCLKLLRTAFALFALLPAAAFADFASGHQPLCDGASRRRQTRDGGDAGSGGVAGRARCLEAWRQCGGCGGRGRLRARRHTAARGQSRWRRLHADPSRRPEENHRHRLSRDRAGADHEGRFPRRQWRGRSVQVALFRSRHRRAGNRRRARTRVAQIWLGQSSPSPN